MNPVRHRIQLNSSTQRSRNTALESRAEDSSLYHHRKQPNRTQRPRREKPHAEAEVDFGRMELGHVFTVTTRWSLNSPRFPSTDVHMFYLWIWNTVKTTYNKNKENI